MTFEMELIGIRVLLGGEMMNMDLCKSRLC
jgi:hypothetical protein